MTRRELFTCARESDEIDAETPTAMHTAMAKARRAGAIDSRFKISRRARKENQKINLRISRKRKKRRSGCWSQWSDGVVR